MCYKLNKYKHLQKKDNYYKPNKCKYFKKTSNLFFQFQTLVAKQQSKLAFDLYENSKCMYKDTMIVYIPAFYMNKYSCNNFAPELSTLARIVSIDEFAVGESSRSKCPEKDYTFAQRTHSFKLFLSFLQEQYSVQKFILIGNCGGIISILNYLRDTAKQEANNINAFKHILGIIALDVLDYTKYTFFMDMLKLFDKKPYLNQKWLLASLTAINNIQEYILYNFWRIRRLLESAHTKGKMSVDTKIVCSPDHALDSPDDYDLSESIRPLLRHYQIPLHCLRAEHSNIRKQDLEYYKTQSYFSDTFIKGGTHPIMVELQKEFDDIFDTCKKWLQNEYNHL